MSDSQLSSASKWSQQQMPDRDNPRFREEKREQLRNLPVTADCQVWVSSATEDAEWDAFLMRTPGGHYMQSSAWARLKGLSGWRAARLVVTRQDCIVGGAQLLLRALPFLGGVGYVSKGPLVAADDVHLHRLVVEAMHRVARSQRAKVLVVQPPGSGQVLARLLPGWGFRSNPKIGTLTNTVLIDLTRDVDDLLARMQKRTRSNIRRSRSQGVTVREGTPDDLETFYRLLEIAGRRKRFSLYSKKYYRELWRCLDSQENIKLFLAEYDGEAVSALLGIAFGDTMFTYVSAWSGHHRERKPNEALEWAAMTWAKEHGYRYYDFEGIDPQAAGALLQYGLFPDAQSWAADMWVSSFKLGFGGQVTLLPEAYDYIYNPLLRWAYREVLPKIEHWSMVAKARKRLMRASQPEL